MIFAGKQEADRLLMRLCRGRPMVVKVKYGKGLIAFGLSVPFFVSYDTKAPYPLPASGRDFCSR
jgi:hypothetical protein